jgi:hypothetical protein
MVLKPRQSGIVAICDCGTKQFIPSESAIRTGILYCPCGHLEKIDHSVFSKIMARVFRSAVSEKTGRPYKQPAKREENDRLRYGRSGVQRTIDYEFEPLR